MQHAPAQKLPLQGAAAGAKGAVSSSAQAMRRRSGVAGASMWNQPARLASARAAYAASCTRKDFVQVRVLVSNADAWNAHNDA